MQKLMRSLLAALSLVTGLAGASSALATTTTLTFDDVPSGSNLTTQYQNVGVTVSGTSVIAATLAGVPTTNTLPNIAYAPSGLMLFTLNTAITGNVQSVSAYLTGPANVGIYAYDASNTLVGQMVTSTAVTDALVTVTTSGNPIARVEIHDGGASFFADTVTFTSANTPFANFAATLYVATKQSAFAASETFTLGTNSPDINPSTQAVTLTFGTLTINLPAGSFVPDAPPRKQGYVYRGTTNGVDLFVYIYPTNTPRMYQLFVLGGHAFPAGVSLMPVALTIGDNSGSVNVRPNYVKLAPTSP